MKALLLVLAAAAVQAAYWMEQVKHQGIAPFNPDKGYQVFRNVKDFGAKGDGVTDDTAAINQAISTGNRCGGAAACTGSTITPAVVYFPPGTYMISTSLIGYYYTQIIGDANQMPVLKASAGFKDGAALLDANPYTSSGVLRSQSTNTFFRQVRNLVFDTTAVPGPIWAMHWPMAQATSIQNCLFRLSRDYSKKHVGIFMEEGSGGFLGDLVFQGGFTAMMLGNQQYTARNISVDGAETAIEQLWDWGWTYNNLRVSNCKVGINMSTQNVGSVTLLDSQFTNVDTAMVTGRTSTNKTGQGSLVVESVGFTAVPTVLAGPGDKPLVLGHRELNVYDPGLTMGNVITPDGSTTFTGAEAAARKSDYYPRPKALLQGNKYYARSKPTYQELPVSSFISARTSGAAGDGVTDDTAALNKLFAIAATSKSVAFVDAGYYLVSDTVHVPPGARIVGEGLASVILGAGKKFSDMGHPHPVVQVGQPGQKGSVEISDLLLSTKGRNPGAVLMQYNLATPAGAGNCSAGRPPSGLWDVHARVGGFAGSDLQVKQCVKTPDVVSPKGPLADSSCVAAHTSLHITETAGNLYMENNWLWVADHDIEDSNNTQINVYAGRGLLVESRPGRIWLSGTSVEHHTLYQYQLSGTRDVYMGQIQTETPYYQPNPPAPYPFTPDPALGDPDFAHDCAITSHRQESDAGIKVAPCAMAWGLRVLDSTDVVVFGAGLYSFFNNYNVSCSTRAAGEVCQSRMFWDANNTKTAVYNLDTVGVVNMVTKGPGAKDLAFWQGNFATFASTLALYVAGV